MKTLKISTFLAAFAIAAFGFAPQAFAFHDGGVAYCDGCHTMHNSSSGKAMSRVNPTQFTGVDFLLQGTDDSSTCLNCHATTAAKAGGYHIMTFPAPATGTAPANTTPGGDFAWLTQTFTGDLPYMPVGSNTYLSKGERHGHNVVALDFGLLADTTLLTAPGGTYAAGKLACTSCHDPHSRARVVDVNGTIAYNQLGAKTLPIAGSGSYGAVATATEAVGVYRLLGGKNYVNEGANYTFTTDSPVAVAPSTYNRTEAVTDTRVAYGKGMSEWCANCHTDILNGAVGMGGTKLIHPAGNGATLANATTVWGAPTTQAGIYNAYKASGDLTNTVATSYTSLVPYEEGTTIIATLLTDSAATTGPSTGTENVMCLTCHRAHAGGFDSSTRWTNRGEFLTVAGAWPGTELTATRETSGAQYSNGMNSTELKAAMGGRDATKFATYQRSLCNKCHAKD